MEIKKFIAKIVILATLLVTLYFLAQWKLSQEYVDYYYNKFTYPAGSMILGVSRAFDGIAPAVIEEELGQEGIAAPVLNFAFELAQSPYGAVYLEAIQKKLKPDVKNGLFILSVSPGNLTIPQHVPDSAGSITDEHSLFTKIEAMNRQPNFEYIRAFYGESLYKAFIRYAPYNIRTVHKDGWMEVVLKTKNVDIQQYEMDGWKGQTINSYKERIRTHKRSQVRLAYLGKTIELLRQHGKVFLIRMPTDIEVLQIENGFWPAFEQDMDSLARAKQVVFLSYAEAAGEYQTYDGSHLVSSSAKAFTSRLCSDINTFFSENK